MRVLLQAFIGLFQKKGDVNFKKINILNRGVNRGYIVFLEKPIEDDVEREKFEIISTIFTKHSDSMLGIFMNSHKLIPYILNK